LKKEKLVEPRKKPFFLNYFLEKAQKEASLEQQFIDAFLHASLSYWKAGYQKKPTAMH